MVVLYHMSHQFEEQMIHVSLLSNREMNQDEKHELAEELSHFPHSDRRNFMQKLHSLYQQTTCTAQILQELTPTAYSHHITDQDQKMVGIMLKYDRPSRYHYMIFIESVWMLLQTRTSLYTPINRNTFRVFWKETQDFMGKHTKIRQQRKSTLWLC